MYRVERQMHCAMPETLRYAFLPIISTRTSGAASQLSRFNDSFPLLPPLPLGSGTYIAHKKGNASENVLDGSLFTFYFFVSAGRQQIRGSWAPVSFPRIRLPPKAVRSTTCPGRLSVTRPIMAACYPPEVWCSASSTAPARPGETTASIRHSQAL